MKRYLIGITGASGSVYGVDFVRRCPGEKYLVLSDWARHVLQSEPTGHQKGLGPAPRRRSMSSTASAVNSSSTVDRAIAWAKFVAPGRPSSR